jgi:hypothetical protein
MTVNMAAKTVSPRHILYSNIQGKKRILCSLSAIIRAEAERICRLTSNGFAAPSTV